MAMGDCCVSGGRSDVRDVTVKIGGKNAGFV